MDFFRIVKGDPSKDGVIDVFPDFYTCRSDDLMIRGGKFYAIWDPRVGFWSTNAYDAQELIDLELKTFVDALPEDVRYRYKVHYTKYGTTSGSWKKFLTTIDTMGDNFVQLDDHLTFENTPPEKNRYASKSLPYSLSEEFCPSFDALIGSLYDPTERTKIEWAIGSIVAGDSKSIQKFIVLYGAAGSGKSTVLNIIQLLFDGYYTTFDSQSLTRSGNSFSTEDFRGNPLVGVQHEGDLSKITDNSRLNSIVSHDEMVLNEKYKSSYSARINAFLFVASNNPVLITDAKSGVIRRLIDVHPSGRHIPYSEYKTLMHQIKFELGAIANHCLNVYKKYGPDYYDSYIPRDMMQRTDHFYNFIEEYYFKFANEDKTYLKTAYDLYSTFCNENNIEKRHTKYKFRDELKNYFKKFESRAQIDGERAYNVYSGFRKERFISDDRETPPLKLALEFEESLLDKVLAQCPAQYATENETPRNAWSSVSTKLRDLNTSTVHYVQPPLNHIVIDFDLKDEHGEKNKEKNLIEAAKWPLTYAEYSKGGSGIHLHYIYTGDVEELSRIYDDDIEVKVFVGNSSLRRRLSKCNDVNVATLAGGLPLRKKKPMLDPNVVMTEKGIRDLIHRNIRKEIHPATKPSVDFISKILDDAYKSGVPYDVSDLKGAVIAFANNSTNQADLALKTVARMQFSSMSEPTGVDQPGPIVYFDVEVFPNLFHISWKTDDSQVVRMVNPTPDDVEQLVRNRLIGFNNRRYDNHILYGRIMGYDNDRLYKLSKRIISGDQNAYFGEAYNLSYADIYDYAATKQGLKKWQIELGLNHKELGLDWDEPVPEELWPEVAKYCDNDVETTEAVHKHLIADFNARLLLSELSGLGVNNTTQQHTAKIIFGNERHPQKKFQYHNLSDPDFFPGYEFQAGVSTYRGEKTGEGGYVYAEPGMYENVVVLDVASMHPTSIRVLNLFGPFTKNFNALVDARLAIKHKDHELVGSLLGGALKPYLKDEETADQLSHALKIVINSVYGLTNAGFDNKFKDPRNIDNIVAKYGALFMVNLKHEVQERGYQVVHIKTDSIKIPNASEEIIEFINEYGRSYGFTFEYETTFHRFCLINDAVFVGLDDDGWTAIGAQFKRPYVFKKLFTGEPIEFEDLCETRSVQKGEIYLNMGTSEEPDYHFVGRAGRFTPVKNGGGELLRKSDDKYHAVQGTKGYRWLESEVAREVTPSEDIDESYYISLVDDAVKALGEFGDVEALLVK